MNARWGIALLLAAGASMLAGCGPFGHAIGLLLVLSGALLVQACHSSKSSRSRAGDIADGGSAGSGEVVGGGRAERCCVEHELKECICQNGPCNYGYGLKICDDGSCRGANEQCPRCLEDDVAIDSSKALELEPLNGWERCCLLGETRLCPVQPTLECGYAEGVTFHPDGSCSRMELDGGS